ncbi:MAG: hypothetical protein ACOWWM_20885 [Desulfobacterales bacterium]
MKKFREWDLTGAGDIFAEESPRDDRELSGTGLLAEILEAVETHLNDKKLVMMDPGPKAKLLTLLYRHFLESGTDGKQNPQIVKKFMQVVLA